MNVEIAAQDLVTVAVSVKILHRRVNIEAQTTFSVRSGTRACLIGRSAVVAPNKEAATATKVEIGVQANRQSVVHAVAKIGRYATVAAIRFAVIAVAVQAVGPQNEVKPIEFLLPGQCYDIVLCSIVTGDPENMRCAFKTAFPAGR